MSSERINRSVFGFVFIVLFFGFGFEFRFLDFWYCDFCGLVRFFLVSLGVKCEFSFRRR